MSEIPADVSNLADDILMSINWQHIPTQDYAHAKDVITRAIMGDRASRDDAQETADNAALAALAGRHTRLLGICNRIRWGDFGVPAMENEQTKAALIDLFILLCADAMPDAFARHLAKQEVEHAR